MTKRFAVLVAATALGFGAAGCAVAPNPDRTDPATLGAAIDAYLADRPERICTAPLYLPDDERVDGHGDPVWRAARREERRWLDGLSGAGLLIKARTTARGTGDSGPTPVDEYVLSTAGRNELDDARRVDLGAPARFCVAATRVGIVLTVVPHIEHGGTQSATVRYRPALAARAGWTRRARARSAMPWLAQWTNAQLTERRVTLRLTAGGWIVL